MYSGEDSDSKMKWRFEELPSSKQKYLQDIFSGAALPPLYSDIIAKSVFSADVHPDRLNFLLQGITKDDTIDVLSSASNEAFRKSLRSKGIITDIPSWLKDKRFVDLEVQKTAQEFIFTRGDLYASSMLLLQYSVDPGQAKEDLHYQNVKEALLVILMADSPKVFHKFDKTSGRYIHRFTHMTADSNLSYPRKAKVIYVQLDKCLEQFRHGTNAESVDNKPDKLQTWLSMIADVNDQMVSEAAR